MRIIHIMFVLFSASTLSAGSPPSAPIVLKSGKATIEVPQNGPEGPKDWRALACQGGGETAVLHAAIRRGDTLYVLFTLAGWSRGSPSDRGHCGSGWEKQMNWMEIRGGAVTAHHQRDLESCWRDAYGSIDGWKGSRLLWGTGERDGQYDYLFDSVEPEKGIQVAAFKSYPKRVSERAGTEQPATRSVDEPEGGDKSQPEAGGRSR